MLIGNPMPLEELPPEIQLSEARMCYAVATSNCNDWCLTSQCVIHRTPNHAAAAERLFFFPWLYGQKNLDTSSSVSWNSSTNASVCGADRGFLSTSCMGCRAWLTTWLGTHSSCLRITCPVSNMFCLRLKAPPCKFGESMAHYSTSRKNAFGYDKCLKQKHPHHPRFKPALYPQLTEIEWSNISFSCMNHLPSGYLT
jgi:hypothetical protein